MRLAQDSPQQTYRLANELLHKPDVPVVNALWAAPFIACGTALAQVLSACVLASQEGALSQVRSL